MNEADLNQSAELFGRYYPEYAAQMRIAAATARIPLGRSRRPDHAHRRPGPGSPPNTSPSAARRHRALKPDLRFPYHQADCTAWPNGSVAICRVTTMRPLGGSARIVAAIRGSFPARQREGASPSGLHRPGG